MRKCRVQVSLLRVLLSCCMLAVRQSVGGPTNLNAFDMRPLNWTREGVSRYTISQPFYVVMRDYLKFQCEETDSTSLVYLLRADVYERVSGACNSSGILPEAIDFNSLCIPDAIEDCRNDRLETRVTGKEETANSCTVSSFRPNTLYYLANFPSNDSQRCLFAMPLKVCARNDPDCPPSPPPSPSITTTTTTVVSTTVVSPTPGLITSPPPEMTNGSGSGSGSPPSLPSATIKPSSLPSMSPSPTLPTSSASTVHSLLAAVSLCSLLFSLSSCVF